MKNTTLHITNGSSLTKILQQLKFEGEILTWHEMLCEGPTQVVFDTEDAINERKQFLESNYPISYKAEEFKNELKKIEHLNSYKNVVLWFEYDLFCHINLIAVISLLKQRQIHIPMYLVCSGRIEGEADFKGLAQLTPQQLKTHFDAKQELDIDDIALAQKAWRLYCEDDHNLLKPLITRPSNFKYLSNCLKAHLKRFRDTVTGLNTLQYNILKLIHSYDIKSKHHLLGYALHYQGYYGYGDIQLERIIDELNLFYTEEDEKISLNRTGFLALEKQKNVRSLLEPNIMFGGVNSKDFQFNAKENKLIKTQNHGD